jgi:hypothetical protein
MAYVKTALPELFEMTNAARLLQKAAWPRHLNSLHVL